MSADENGPYLCYCNTSRSLTRRISKIFEHHLRPSGITATDLAVLEFIVANENITVAALAERMSMDRTTLVRTLKPLTEKGLLLRSMSTEMSRRHVMAITDEGIAKIVQARPLWMSAQQEWEVVIGEERAQALRGSMQDALHL